jgi:hypothetical protein
MHKRENKAISQSHNNKVYAGFYTNVDITAF